MEFTEINKDNWKECCDLHTKEDIYIASNLYSIAEAQFYTKAISKAISVDNEIVGYVMFGEDEDRSDVFWIDRFMIGKHFRRKGYAVKALNKIVELAKENNQFTKIETSTDKKNLPMQACLEKAGFRTNNKANDNNDNEIVYFFDQW